MPECRNCGAFVSKRYVRVRSRDDGEAGVSVCPHCPDRTRSADGHPRETRGSRDTGAKNGNYRGLDR